MPVPSLSDLLTPVTPDEVFAQELYYAQQLGLPATAWQPVSIGREILSVNGTIVSNWSTTMTEGPVAGGFLTYASGAWLTLCAYEIFDTERIESSYATGKIGLANSEAVPYTVVAGAVRILNEDTGETYTCTSGGVVPAGGSIETIDWSADAPGTSSNLTSGQTLSLVTTVPGITPYWVQDLIGQDEESDPNLRSRARSANAKASPNGPADAYDYYAKTTDRPDGTSVGVTRTNQVQGNGTVTLYLADADGPLTTQDRDYVFDNVNANVVPSGFTVVIPDPSCDTLDIAVAMTLTPNPDSSASRADVESRIQTAIVAYFATIPVGGDKAQSFQGIYLSTLVQLIRNAGSTDVLNVVVTAPLTDQALANDEIPVLDGDITVAWTS